MVPWKHQTGFTLVEVLVSLLLISIATLALIHTQKVGLGAARTAYLHARALTYVNSITATHPSAAQLEHLKKRFLTEFPRSHFKIDNDEQSHQIQLSWQPTIGMNQQINITLP